MPALAPTITQIGPTNAPVTAGSLVADLSTDPGESDPGPFTYNLTDDASGAVVIAASGTQLEAATDLDGTYDVAATVTGSDATPSPETTATLTFQDTAPAIEDPYENNPQFPPPLPDGTTEAPWEYFIVTATNMLVPNARNGVDFVVARPSKDEPQQNIHWDDAVLGPRPDAEIEQLARDLASQYPLSGTPTAKRS